MQEEFKPIKDFEGLYEISNLGRVKNLLNRKMLKNTFDKSSGYYRVHLSKNGKIKKKRVHILIVVVWFC